MGREALATAMPPTQPLELTLIVAATRSLGIGNAGKLPWPAIKSEMAYFTRVTKYVPPTSVSAGKEPCRNAVIMGRKTWESIPERFRPLRDRINVVLSWTGVTAGAEAGAQAEADGERRVIVVDALDKAIEALEASRTGARAGESAVSRAFVMGGSAVYDAALRMPQTTRVLLTKIYTDFECDTFFPLDLESEQARKEGWLRKSREQLEQFLGGEAGPGRMKEGEVEFEFCMFERTSRPG